MFFLLSVAALVSGVAAEQYQNDATQQILTRINHSLSYNYLLALLALVVIVFVARNTIRIYAHIRHLSSMNGDGTQKYFSKPSGTANWIKDHILYAPLFHYKRATEIKFSRHINFGNLPSRFNSLFIGAFIAYNVFACVWNVPWSSEQLEVLPILRARTGTLATVNLIPILVMATIKNPLIKVLDISYDSFNLLHRWLGRLSILQGIAHTLCHVISVVDRKGWSALKVSVQGQFIYAGLIATIGLTIILFQSPKLIRSLAYEIFLYSHIAIVIVTFATLWIHLKALPQRFMLLSAVIVWGVARLWRLSTLIYRSWGAEQSKAMVETMPGQALRLTLTSPRPWQFQPGQSLYLTVPAVGWLTAHPFSVAWNDVQDSLSRQASVRSTGTDIEKRPFARNRKPEIEQSGNQTYSLVVKARTGLTKKLHDYVERNGRGDGNGMSLNCLIEGPYGMERSLSSYGTVLLFASGVGITHQIPYVKELLEGYNNGTVAARRITLVWTVPTTDSLEWIRPWMHDILGIENRRDVLKVILYITRAGLSQPINSPSETVRMLRGRPDVLALMKKEAAEKMGCMGVSVCAGGGLADEVRRCSRLLLEKNTNLDFIEEGFGW